MKKTYLLTPGPTPIPESILATSAQPILHHRTPLFKKLMHEVQDGLKYLFQTKQDVMILTSSGTGAMDAAVSNLFCKGDTVITINGGKFGERWTKLASAYGLKPVEIKLEPGKALSLKEFEKVLASNSGAKGVLMQASETSTGTAFPVKEIAALVSRLPDCLLVVDAITALGVMDLQMDNWGIDALMTGSQKGLMLPPGLAFISLSDKAWKASAKSDISKFYFDLKKEKKNLADGQTAWTPAISIITGLAQALQMLREEGLQAVFARHAHLGKATMNAVKALGLKTLSESPSNAVTAVMVPSQIKDGKLIPKTMRDKHGVTITGGQDELEGKIFRLTHLGYVGPFDILTGIGALELTLRELGYREFELGAGVTAALKTFEG